MIKLKFYKTKTAKFLAGKGFYLVLAVCMTAMGIAVYSALDTAEVKNQEEQSNISSEPSEIIPPTIPEEESIIEESVEEESAPTDNDTEAGYFILPIEAQIIKSYDNNYLQYSSTYNDMRLHTGTDLKPIGSGDVLSAGKGVVTEVKENTIQGNVITVDHYDGIVIRYCGIKNITVKANDQVSAGDILGEVGVVANESSDEAHIHIEVFKDGKSVNPEEFFGIQN